MLLACVTLCLLAMLICHGSLQGWTLLLIGPFLDRYVSSSWVFDFSYSFNAVVFLVLSCSMAVFVNISQFMCLGRFSAVSFQVRSGVFNLYSFCCMLLLFSKLHAGSDIQCKT